MTLLRNNNNDVVMHTDAAADIENDHATEEPLVGAGVGCESASGVGAGLGEAASHIKMLPVTVPVHIGSKNRCRRRNLFMEDSPSSFASLPLAELCPACVAVAISGC